MLHKNEKGYRGFILGLVEITKDICHIEISCDKDKMTDSLLWSLEGIGTIGQCNRYCYRLKRPRQRLDWYTVQKLCSEEGMKERSKRGKVKRPERSMD